jgi:hypothetical protein
MSATHGKQKVPDASREEKISVELVKRMHKLRWMGLDDEADRIQTQLKSLRSETRACVLLYESFTD